MVTPQSSDVQLALPLQQSNITRTQELVLKSKMNNKALIFWLPIEIISEVFKLLQADEDWGWAESEEYSGYLWHWTTITHVCRIWRDIAINTQTLWAYIDTWEHASIDKTKVFLERSGTTSLTVHHEYEFHGNSLRSLHVALEQFQRIRVLHISGLEEITAEIRTALRNPAPLLQKLTFETDSSEVIDLRDLLSGHAPNLTDIELHSNSPSWADIPIMQNLSFIRVGSPSSPLTLQETYSILSKNPNIKRFRIFSQPRVSRPEDLKPPKAPIRLLDLKRFEVINGNYELISALIKNTVFPDSIHWVICCQDYPIRRVPRADPRSIIPRTSSICGSMGCNILELTISQDCVTIASESIFRSTDSDNGESQPKRCLRYSWNSGIQEEQIVKTIADGFSVVCSAISGGFWCSANTLIVDIVLGPGTRSDSLFGHRTWIPLLLLLPELEKLTVRHVSGLVRPSAVRESHRNLLEALAFTCNDENGNSPPICPKLSILRLCGIDLNFDLEDLVFHLSRRASYGFQLQKLQLCEAAEIEGSTIETLARFKISGAVHEIKILKNHYLEDLLNLEEEVIHVYDM